MIKVGVIGYGYWGPNVVRNLRNLDSVEVAAIWTRVRELLKRAKRAYPDVHSHHRRRELLTSPDIDAIAVITPVWTHFELAKERAGERQTRLRREAVHLHLAQAEELIDLAERKDLQIMVDHTFLFTGAVKKIRQLIDDGTLGNLYYYDSTRVNLGLFQHDVNVLWDLAPHDLSIVDYLIEREARGGRRDRREALERS